MHVFTFATRYHRLSFIFMWLNMFILDTLFWPLVYDFDFFLNWKVFAPQGRTVKCARRGEGGRRVFFCKVLSEIYLEPGEWISRGMKGSEVPGKRKKVRFQHIHTPGGRKYVFWSIFNHLFFVLLMKKIYSQERDVRPLRPPSPPRVRACCSMCEILLNLFSLQLLSKGTTSISSYLKFLSFYVWDFLCSPQC